MIHPTSQLVRAFGIMIDPVKLTSVSDFHITYWHERLLAQMKFTFDRGHSITGSFILKEDMEYIMIPMGDNVSQFQILAENAEPGLVQTHFRYNLLPFDLHSNYLFVDRLINELSDLTGS